MPYTLKLDWRRPRMDAVSRALCHPGSVPVQTRAMLIDRLELPLLLDEINRPGMTEHGATITVDLNEGLLDCLERALVDAVSALRDILTSWDLPQRPTALPDVPLSTQLAGRGREAAQADLAQLEAALADIRGYRETVAAIRRDAG